MERSLLCAGFGGQGVMLIGKNVSKACIKNGQNATFYPSYGAEMRGGTANCHVCISDGEIDSPVKQHPDELIVMNGLSYERFMDTVKRGGRVFVNSSLIHEHYDGDDIDVKYIPVADIANKLGQPLVANTVMLGAYVGCSDWIDPDLTREVIRENLSDKPELIDINLRAFQEGLDYVCRN